MLKEGLSHTVERSVTIENCALSLGSGDLPVFATPAMVAFMENAAMLAVAQALPDGTTTVGGEINVQHLKPSVPGAVVSATATLVGVDGRKLTFEVTASDGEVLIGRGNHLRFIVDKQRFMEKL